MCAAKSAPILFTTGIYHAVELGIGDIPRLQSFFELNPEYFVSVNGQPPHSAEAYEEVNRTLPEGWPFTKKWTIGFVDKAVSLIGMADIVSDLLAPNVWHIGLFIVATRLHGSGAAQALYQQLERWAFSLGAQWMRLGVVHGNTRAERFWASCAFVEVRRRSAEMGNQINILRVMAKPLAAGTLPEYLALVPRDRPGSG
jgi:RimJ/RimL family protein N-acetyltransferase